MTLASDLSKSRHESSASRLNFFSKRLWAWLLVPYVCPYQTCALHIQRLSKVLENFPTHRFPVPTFWVWVVVFLHPWKGGFYNGFDLRPVPKVLGGFWEIVIWPNTWSDLLGNPPQAWILLHPIYLVLRTISDLLTGSIFKSPYIITWEESERLLSRGIFGVVKWIMFFHFWWPN